MHAVHMLIVGWLWLIQSWGKTLQLYLLFSLFLAVVSLNVQDKEDTAAGVPDLLHSQISRRQQRLYSSTVSICQAQPMDVVQVVCGDRMDESLNMVKSILIFSQQSQLHFHFVVEDTLQKNIKTKFESFPENIRARFQYTIYNLSFPTEKWKKLFKPCAAQRLFILNFIKKDKVLYLDTDTLLLSPLELLWSHFNYFNQSQIASMVPEHEIPGWYSLYSDHPYYGPFGLNSGVMLMDLKRLREIGFEKKIIDIHEKYLNVRLPWGDQDLLNIFFHQYPDLVYVLPCEWNYRSDHCSKGENNCKGAVTNGIYVIHGNRRIFHNNKQPAFKLISDVIKAYKFNEDIQSTIIDQLLQDRLTNPSQTNCHKMIGSFVKNMNREQYCSKTFP